MGSAKYGRVLLKLSGDFMAGEAGFGLEGASSPGVARHGGGVDGKNLNNFGFFWTGHLQGAIIRV